MPLCDADSTVMGDSATRAELPLPTEVQYIYHTLDPANAEESALEILSAYDVSWAKTEDHIEIKITGGWTNTLVKAKRNIPGKSKAEMEADAFLVRGYGVGTEAFIDREKNEVKAHCLLSEYERIQVLQEELTALCEEFVDAPGLGGKDYVFIHGHLHDANVIIREPSPMTKSTPPTDKTSTPMDQASSATDTKSATIDTCNTSKEPELKVDFIDYEYCMPAPPAFELAYHFSEWAGFDCEYQFIATKSDRRRFIRSYVEAFHEYAKTTPDTVEKRSDLDSMGMDIEKDEKYLEKQVDAFRGVPGMYWALWALMQIHRMGEDYSAFHETKVKECWDWKGEGDGSRKESSQERRWMEE
ncbi:Protein kinase-like (PK-like) [Venturia nashicola]|uniref:ethanolamine kinase n=1 Tax=Venturia nashicola TaxID=86259 RepID=A0A4Z1PA17_9PEZI|nr:Protein kinase-like (PK-like) [Venturia nashicola]